ncbi:hypothetical protein NIES208_02565 [[Limnothrix rosea] IAM M-220]|nr:hypothetical protein NIES208_02565 [[Limnothrix rosea] IAM M-220]
MGSPENYRIRTDHIINETQHSDSIAKDILIFTYWNFGDFYGFFAAFHDYDHVTKVCDLLDQKNCD